MNQQATPSKAKSLKYSKLQLQPYLQSGAGDLTKKEKLGSECNVEVKDQPHLLQGNKFIEDGEQNTPNYSDLFSDDAGKISAVIRILQRKFTLLKNYNNQSAHNTVTVTCHSNDSASTLPRQRLGFDNK